MRKTVYHKKIRNKIMGMLISVLLIASVSLCLFIVIQVLGRGYATFGRYSFFRVVTGSMEPSVPVGSLIITEETDINDLNRGDIITFRSKASHMLGEAITHRVVEKTVSENGEVFLQTKGDANLTVDSYYVDSGNLIGKVIRVAENSDFLSVIVSFLTDKRGFTVCIVLPVLIISSMLIRNSVKTIKQDMSKLVEEIIKVDEDGNKKCNSHSDSNSDTPYSKEENDTTGITDVEYQEMYEAIRAELIEELKKELSEDGEQ